MIVSEPKELIAQWIGARLGIKFNHAYSTLAFVDKNMQIQAALLFHSWSRNDIEITVVAQHLPRSLLRAAEDYVFNELKCRRVTFRTRADNEAAAKAMSRLGGELEGRMRQYFDDGCDALIFGILEKDYPFGLPQKSSHV